MKRCLRIAWATVSLGCMACGDFSGAGARPEGHRLVEGVLDVEDASFTGRQTTGVQMAAVAVSAGEPQLFVSDVVDPSTPGGAPFVVAVDEEQAFSLVLQVPGSGGAGDLLAVYAFATDADPLETLLPAGTDDLDLGVLTAFTEEGLDYVTSDDASHPLGQIDSDRDGSLDRFDDDDDDDNVSDGLDDDVAGDGVADATQGYNGLADNNGDGIADLWQ